MRICNSVVFFYLAFLILLNNCKTRDLGNSRFTQNAATEYRSKVSDLGQNFSAFVMREQMPTQFSTSSLGKSEVAKEYQATSGIVFKVLFVDLLVDSGDIHVIDSNLGSAELRQQIFIQHEDKKYFRFFIHPESAKLYEPLVEKTESKFKGFYLGTPTASTRSVLVWNPKTIEVPFFAKMTLDKVQSGMGRSIPDWEVRKSVLITKQFADLSNFLIENPHKVKIVPEIAGAYVDKKLKLGSYVDSDQGTIYQHGVIIRSADFLANSANYSDVSNSSLVPSEVQSEIFPTFSIFAERGEKPPLFIEWWKQSGMPFYDFLSDRFIEPFIEQTSHLIFHEGVVPEIHAQNFLVRVDSKSKRVLETLHRDVGSMKVLLPLRWSRGLPIDSLRSTTSLRDFKFARDPEVMDIAFIEYFFEFIFTNRTGVRAAGAFSNHFKDYNVNRVERIVKLSLAKALKKHYQIELNESDLSQKNFLGKASSQFILSHPPKFNLLPLGPSSKVDLKSFVNQKMSAKEFFELPPWSTLKDIGDFPALTPYGVVFVSPGNPGRFSLAVFDDKFPDKPLFD